MGVKLLTEHHLEFLSLKGGCTGSSDSTLVKIPNCWKPHVAAHIIYKNDNAWSFIYILYTFCSDKKTNFASLDPYYSTK